MNDDFEAKLIAAERKYRNLADNAPLGVYQSNLKGEILYANNSLAGMFEFASPQEFMRENALSRYKNPKDRQILIENLKKTGRLDNYEVELLTRSGKVKSVLLNATLEGDLLSGMLLDITERKRLEEEAKKRTEELEKMNKFMVGRELEMIELKKEINRLLGELGREERYHEI